MAQDTNGEPPRCVLHQKNRVKKMNRYAIVMCRTKRMVGSAATYDIAVAAVNAVVPALRKNYEIVPQIDEVPANEN